MKKKNYTGIFKKDKDEQIIGSTIAFKRVRISSEKQSHRGEKSHG